MGREVGIYGYFECPATKVGTDYNALCRLNIAILKKLPATDNGYPRISRSPFNIPFDSDICRQQRIVFSCTFKDDLYTNQPIPDFMNRFEHS